ncbi:MAG: DUF1028 domain-containing protein [Bacteroides sp.]|jgi:uncharacterized Ntn-hydrolase superfamily protein|nr:DUF1028 domain-containing protein [Bacteroides sp.]
MRKAAINLMMVILMNQLAAGQVYKQTEPFAHTYSIVARDPVTGEMAIGVQSHWFSVGTVVSWGKSGVGVVATQSFVNPALGPDGLALMEEGLDAQTALERLISEDEGRDFRQVAFLDATGNVDAYTGAKCIAWAGHYVGENYSVQANMMLNDLVIPAMRLAFESNAHLPLAERVIETMKAAEAAGGDIRGRQSAALLVVSGTTASHPSSDKLIDLRVDDHPLPLEELERLLRVHRAYTHMNNGDLAMEAGDMQKAMEEYGAAEQMFPDNLEMKYWKAIGLANSGSINEALPILKAIFQIDGNWKELTRRLHASGLLNISEADLEKIMNL